LYTDGRIHGDVQAANIMVKRDGVDSKGLRDIIPIDWAREESTNITLKHRNLWHPKSIQHGGLISSVHDVGTPIQ